MEFVKKYKNGLRVIVKEMPGLYSLTMGFCVGVGSCREDKSNNGFAHFIEHMMFKGTPTRTSFQISDAFDRIGGQLNAFTSKDMTCYYARVASEYAERSVEILSDMLLNATFEEVEMDKERKVILEEITMGEDEPDEVCHDLLAEALYGNDRLGQTIIGTKELISKATRDDLMKFIDRFYGAENIVVSFAGNIKFQTACQYVEKYFLPKLNEGRATLPIDRQEVFSKYLFKVKDVEQAHIAVGFNGVPLGAKDSAAYAVFGNALGGGMSSRLFQRIREENGMAYTVYAYPSYYVNNGYLEIYAGTNPKNIPSVLNLIKDEIDKLLHDGLTDEEFERAKGQLKGEILLAQESTAAVMRNLGKTCLLLDKKYVVEEKIKEIDDTTKQDAEAVMRKVLDRSAVALAIVSKNKPAEDLLEKFRN